MRDETKGDRATFFLTDTKEGEMSDLLNLWYEEARLSAARHQREAASLRVELAEIRVRMAEIVSQHEPLNTLGALNMDARNTAILAARYVVSGRKDWRAITSQEQKP